VSRTAYGTTVTVVVLVFPAYVAVNVTGVETSTGVVATVKGADDAPTGIVTDPGTAATPGLAELIATVRGTLVAPLR
jgi:hypothetical protein